MFDNNLSNTIPRWRLWRRDRQVSDKEDEDESKELVSDGAGESPLSESGGGDQQSPEQEQQPGEDDHDEQDIGFFLPPNSLAHALTDHHNKLDMTPLEALKQTFGTDVSVESVQDVSMGRSLLKIQDVSPMLKPVIRDELLRLSHTADFAIVPCSLGTGYPAYKFVDVDLVFGEIIEQVYQSHKTRQGLYQYPQNSILVGIGSALIDQPAILVDHRRHELQGQDVPTEMARINGALTQVDIANRAYGYWGVGIETVPIGGAAPMDVSPRIRQAENNLEPFVSVEQWAQWDLESGDLDPDSEIPTNAEPDKTVILPHGFQMGQSEKFNIVHADVVDAHVVGFWQLDPQFINEHVRRHGAEFVDREIREPSSPLRQVWESHAKKFGIDNPVDRWDTFYTEKVKPRLPES